MTRRRFRRVAGASAIVGGVTGLAANGLQVLYFALARPWQPGHLGPWEWLGPAIARYVVIGLAAVPGLPAYLAFPVWEIVAGKVWWRDARSGVRRGAAGALLDSLAT